MPTTRQGLPSELPIRYVKGVGPARAQQLARLDIQTVEDVLFALPRRYEDRTAFTTVRQLVPGQLATVRGRLLAKSLRRIRGGKTIFEAAFGDATGVLYGLWFNQPYLEKLLRVDDELILYGRAEPASRRLQFIHPEFERLDPPAPQSKTAPQAGEESSETSLQMGRIVPIYPLTEGVSQGWFRRLVDAVVREYAGLVPEVLSPSLCGRHQLRPGVWAIQQIHFPDNWEALDAARRRLAFEELFIMHVRLALRRMRFTHREKPQRYHAEGPVTDAFLRRLPFALTASQRQVLDELVNDVRKPRPMLRLLQGDVGCGKTVVAAALMAMVVQSGYQVVLMAPTELLAEQHARVLASLFEPIGVTVRLLAQGIAPSERKQLLQQLAHGSAKILVGTHAVIEPEVTFANLALVVIDEQHKFGVVQRARLARKAKTPDVLVMTATPIPRTLALSIYGDLACSTITQLPPGRLPVRTLLIPEPARQDVYQRIREELRQGRQGYVVYPLVEANDTAEVKAATQMARHLQHHVFPDVAVELLHGQMRPHKKDAIMRAFVEGRVQLLVSTVIVEVGLDVPNATIMLIEHPERFGLAQLHQLRGRIGRGSHPATCFVISDAADETVRKRLAAFVETTDGFRLAEYDLALRGPGELLGRRQSGALRFRIADLTRDQELLDATREEAFGLVEKDPQLANPSLAALKRRLTIRGRNPNRS